MRTKLPFSGLSTTLAASFGWPRSSLTRLMMQMLPEERCSTSLRALARRLWLLLGIVA